MGLKIGRFLKKNISFKNFVKYAGKGLSVIPGVGGIAGSVITNLQDAHYAKKQAKQEADELKRQQLLQDSQIKVQKASELAGDYGGTIAGQFASKAIERTYNGMNEGTKNGMAYVGKEVAGNVITLWFKQNWKKLLFWTGGITLFILILKKLRGTNRRRK